jgi:putative phosphonate metabolism protein
MRYAFYFSPGPGDALHELGATWLGRNAATGDAVEHPDLAGLGASELASITGPARRYGFHATLKAPFHLAEGTSEADLIEAMGSFAEQTAHFEIPSLVVGKLEGFLALVPKHPCTELNAFANSVVEAFEPLRAPLSEKGIERRNPESLSSAELRNLMRWGYPYVFNQFRFHMTLTTRLSEPDITRIANAASAHFAPALAAPIKVGALTLFVEPEPGAPFEIHSRADLRLASTERLHA